MSSRAENKRNALLVVKTEDRRPPPLPPPLSLTKPHSLSSLTCFQNKHTPKSPLHRVQNCECVSQVSPCTWRPSKSKPRPGSAGVPPCWHHYLSHDGSYSAWLTVLPGRSLDPSANPHPLPTACAVLRDNRRSGNNCLMKTLQRTAERTLPCWRITKLLATVHHHKCSHRHLSQYNSLWLPSDYSLRINKRNNCYQRLETFFKSFRHMP